MEKYFSNLKLGLTKGTLILLVLSIITLAATTTPRVQAQNQYISITPLQGPVGTSVVVSGGSFTTHGEIIINFGSTEVARTWVVYGWFGGIYSTFLVPSLPSGAYTVTATSDNGNYASTTFTVTSGLSTQTPSSSQTPIKTNTPYSPQATGSYPYLKPTQSPISARGGFWSPLTIALVVIAAALAFIIPTTFIYRRRSGRETLLEEDQPIYNPKTPILSKSPTTSAPYGKSEKYSSQFSMRPTDAIRQNRLSSYSREPATRPIVSTKYNQPARYSKIEYATKICNHCKKTVREDLNVCPYCMKKLK